MVHKCSRFAAFLLRIPTRPVNSCEFQRSAHNFFLYARESFLDVNSLNVGIRERRDPASRTVPLKFYSFNRTLGVSCEKTLCSLGGICRDSRDRSRSTDNDVLSIVRRHACRFQLPRTGNRRGWRTPERELGAARARFRCEEGEIAERTLVFSPHCLSPRCLAFPRTIVPIRTARSHGGSAATSFHCS